MTSLSENELIELSDEAQSQNKSKVFSECESLMNKHGFINTYRYTSDGFIVDFYTRRYKGFYFEADRSLDFHISSKGTFNPFYLKSVLNNIHALHAFLGVKNEEPKKTLRGYPYDVLEVDNNSPEEVVKASYRRLVKKYHPDSKDCPNAARFRKVQEAYEYWKR